MRRGLLILWLVMFLAALMMPATLAADAPRFPQNATEWKAMTAAEQTAVMRYLEGKLRQMEADGMAFTTEVSDSSTSVIEPAQLTDSTADIDTLAPVSVWRNCYVQWTTFPGEGDWVRGGGITDSSAVIDRIYASRPNLKGQFLRDGLLKANWFNEKLPGDHAENWTGQHWTFWWETSNWVTKGWHGAYNNGSWLLGPDNHCYASKTL